MISFRHKFVFVHIPKTAGNAIQNILSEYAEDAIVCTAPHHDGVERFHVRSERFNTQKHSTLTEYRAEIGGEAFRKMFKLAAVRNPWDRMISSYFSSHRGRVLWDRGRFIHTLERVIKPAARYLALDESGSLAENPFRHIDFFIRYEHLQDDFKTACDLIDIPYRHLPVRNKSRRKHYTAYYDDELIERVERLFPREIRHFNYRYGD